MEVIINADVKQHIDEYAEILTSYPISYDRVVEKKANMLNALLSLKNNPYINPVCRYKDLGQKFDKNGNATDKTLRRFNYQDESKFNWAFCYRINKTSSKVTITKMMPSSHVKENNELEEFNMILEFMHRLDTV